MLGVGDGITNDILKEYFKNTTGLLVDEPRDSLHSTSASQTADSRLGDTLDVITQNLSVPLCTSLSKSFSSFAPSWHVASEMNDELMDAMVYEWVIADLLLNYDISTKNNGA